MTGDEPESLKPETRNPISDPTEIASRWGEFLDLVSAKSIPFRLVCDDVELSGISGETVTIGTSKKHTEETFARNKELFTKFLREFFANDSLNYEMKRIERNPCRQ
jgi:hypothetical protein